MSFDIAMSKPHLRREMEANLKRICRAERTKEEVVNEAIAAYEAVFAKVEVEVEKLDQVLSHSRACCCPTAECTRTVYGNKSWNHRCRSL